MAHERSAKAQLEAAAVVRCELAVPKQQSGIFCDPGQWLSGLQPVYACECACLYTCLYTYLHACLCMWSIIMSTRVHAQAELKAERAAATEARRAAKARKHGGKINSLKNQLFERWIL